MGLTAFAIHRRTFTYFATALIFAAGIAAFFQLGQLEDPEFTVKTAVITTQYPGASPQEVELEVTDRIEIALQEIAEIKYIESFSKAGLSIIEVNLRPEFRSKQLPPIWEELRRKIRDIEDTLPPGASRPDISDDFGDVFGFQVAVTGDGYDYAELEEYAKELRRELSLVKGVSRVDLWGVQPKVIYIDASQTQLSQLGLSGESIQATLKLQNQVVDAGSVDVQSNRYRIEPSGSFKAAEEIGELLVQPTVVALAIGRLRGDVAETGSEREEVSELIRIRDIGTVRRGYREPPATLMRYGGNPAIGISITNQPGVNIVAVGKAIDARLAELMARIPIGVEVHRVHWQSEIVEGSVNDFLVSFVQAVAIVLIVLTLAMGWRMGIIIGTSLVVTILASFILMAVFDIDLQRMSLGALIIALGMMVDNSIVVADGISARLRQGLDRKQAAIEAASGPSIPLLGATVIAVLAFYPVFASQDNAGEYCATLFSVVAIALLSSWVVSMTITPLQSMDMLPTPKESKEKQDAYGSGFYRGFRRLLEFHIRARWFTIGAMLGLLGLAILGFGRVEQLFFPDSSMAKFMIDIWAPEGTRIQETADRVAKLEEKIMGDERVSDVTSYIGSGPPRFYLPVDPEYPYDTYGQLVINVKDYRKIPQLAAELDAWINANMPEVLGTVRLFGVGPSNTWKFSARIIGPGIADPSTLRSAAKKVRAILDSSPLTAYSRTDWRERVARVVPVYSQERGRWADVSRKDVANTTKRAYDGRTVGLYREKDDLIPIVLRHVEDERENVEDMKALQIQRTFSSTSIPLAQVTEGIQMAWEDPLIVRRDRRRTIKVQGNPVLGETFPPLWADVGKKIESVELPPGYELEWDGEFESSQDAQLSLVPGVVPAVVLIGLILVGLFNAFRPPLVIALTIPLALIGIVAALLVTGASFGFVALLGAMSLAGMMIKNAIVLLDEINLNLERGQERYQATVQAALSRLRPVVLAAATTVLGVIPLLQDSFWVGLSVAIMGGLSFGTLLTMIMVPVFYSTLYGLDAPSKLKTEAAPTKRRPKPHNRRPARRDVGNMA